MASGPVVGYLAIVVSALGFGSNYLPVKNCRTGDGLFFQLVFCIAVFLVGCVVLWVRGAPAFHPRAMLGGFLWATGNLVSVPAIKLIGMGLAILIWGSSNMLMGWASGTFGLFGLTAAGIARPGLNYAGLVLAIFALVIYMFVQPEDMSSSAPPTTTTSESAKATPKTSSQSLYTSLNEIDELRTELLERGIDDDDNQSYDGSVGHEDDTLLGSLPQAQRSAIGAAIALGAGFCYGCSFDPSQYVIDHHQGSKHGIDYVFAHFTGILVTSIAYFLLYSLYRWGTNRQPDIYPASIPPALLSGTLWAIAMVAWFVSNERLGFSTTFPIVTSTPGLVASLWGILAFGEIKGMRNYLILTVAFSLTIAGCICIALSR